METLEMDVIKFDKKYLSSNKKHIEINMIVNNIEVGYCTLIITTNSLTKETYYDLSAISIYSKYRNKGYSRLLVNYAIKHVKRTNYCIKLKAEPFDDKPVSVNKLKKLYESLGFIQSKSSKVNMLWINPKCQ